MSLDDLEAKTHNSEVWVVEFTDEFEAWWEPLDVEQQAALGVRIGLLESQGSDLGRPAALSVNLNYRWGTCGSGIGSVTTPECARGTEESRIVMSGSPPRPPLNETATGTASVQVDREGVDN
jgi:hypothetical protein